MQLAFFRQQNVDTSDVQVKYKSRAAQLYRDKLHHSANQAMRLHGTKVNEVNTVSIVGTFSGIIQYIILKVLLASNENSYHLAIHRQTGKTNFSGWE